MTQQAHESELEKRRKHKVHFSTRRLHADSLYSAVNRKKYTTIMMMIVVSRSSFKIFCKYHLRYYRSEKD